MIKTVKDKQLAELLQVSRQTIWRWARTGVIPKPFKIGGSTRWSYDEVLMSIKNGIDNE